MLPPPDTAPERLLRRMRVLYRALGDRSRLRVVGLLAERGPLPVNELAERIGLSQPLISWHLRILRLAGLVETRRQGRETLSRLRLAAFDELHELEARLVGGTVGVESQGDATGAPTANAVGEVIDVR